MGEEIAVPGAEQAPAPPPARSFTSPKEDAAGRAWRAVGACAGQAATQARAGAEVVSPAGRAIPGRGGSRVVSTSTIRSARKGAENSWAMYGVCAGPPPGRPGWRGDVPLGD